MDKLRTVFAVMLILIMLPPILAAQGNEVHRQKEAIQTGPDTPGKETNPSSASYRKNLNRFIRDSKKIFPDMKMTDISGISKPSPKPGTVRKTVPEKPDFVNDIGMKFVYIEPGSFIMGSPENEPERYEQEKQHRVTLTRGFFMQTTEMTGEQWTSVMGSNPSHFKNCGDGCPVENASWNDVQEFMEKLNELEGTDSYRLPTEAEWEYAARAGTETAYSFGDDAAVLGEYAWYKENSGGTTHPVAQKKPNAWRLYDMYGNMWEWCQDRYGKYLSDDVTDPVGPDKGPYRIIRGGSFVGLARLCRSANRGNWRPGYRVSSIGFRLVREAP